MGEDVLFPLKASQVDTGFGNPAPVGDLFVRKGVPHWRYPDGTLLPVMAGGGSTALELRNEAREALTKALAFRDEGKTDEFGKAWADYMEKEKAATTLEAEEAQVKAALEKNQPPPSEVRNPEDALIKTVKLEDAKAGVMIQRDEGGFEVVQFADKDTEGWIKGYPPDVQLPGIVRRLTPELKVQAEFRKQAFYKWFRHGLSAVDAKERKALQEGTDSEGGFLVPSDAVKLPFVHDTGDPGGVTRPISSNFNTTRDAGNWPTVGSTSWTSVAEEAAISGANSDPTFGQVAFTVRKIMGLTKVATELLEDSATSIEGIIALLYGESLGRYEDEQAIAGDGSAEPQGLRVASVSDSAGAGLVDASDGWDAGNITNIFFALPAQFRANATWHLTSTALGLIAAIGATSAGLHLLQSIADPVRPNIMGRPYVLFDGTGWDTALSSTNEYGAFGDFRQYYFINRVGMTIKRLDELYAANDQVGFVARVRYDSVVALTAAFLIIKGEA
ncbi:MAG: phage major capsid protein [Chloroflexi bacterium]|nr:phage major capsid protein [Chloroflexota bacterium]